MGIAWLERGDGQRSMALAHGIRQEGQNKSLIGYDSGP